MNNCIDVSLEWVDLLVLAFENYEFPNHQQQRSSPSSSSSTDSDVAKTPSANKKKTFRPGQMDHMKRVAECLNRARVEYAQRWYQSALMKYCVDRDWPLQRLIPLVLGSSCSVVNSKPVRNGATCVITGHADHDGTVHLIDFHVNEGDAAPTSITLCTPFFHVYRLISWWATWPLRLEVVLHTARIQHTRGVESHFKEQLKNVHLQLDTVFQVDFFHLMFK